MVKSSSRYNAAADFLDRHLDAGRGSAIAVRTLSGDLTYAELATRCESFGRALKEIGIGVEDRIALVMPDSPEFVVAFFGAIRLGAVPIPLNTSMPAAGYESHLLDSGATAAVVSARLSETFREARGQVSSLRHVIAVGDAAPGEESFDQLVASGGRLAPAATTENDMAFWLYTSGTTGRPKGIVHRHKDLRITAESFGQGVLGMTEHDVTYSQARLSFGYGLGNAAVHPLWAGAATVLLETPSPDQVMEVLRRLRPTVFFAVPSFFAAAMAWPEADFSSVRLCVSSGESLGASLAADWKAWAGTEILNALGSSEGFSPFICSRPGDSRTDGAGLPVPGFEARIVDATGDEVANGVAGELWMKGGSFFERYWNQPELTRQTIRGEWVRTGDRCVRYDDGYIHHLGRVDDMLKVGGIWVSPAEVEQAINSHPNVRESAVVGVQDGQLLTRIEAFVVPREGGVDGQGLARALRRHVRARLPAFKCPRDFYVVDALPKTVTDKVQRFALREMAAGASGDRGLS